MTNDQWLYLDMRQEIAILQEKQKQLTFLIAAKESEAAAFSDRLSAKEMIDVANIVRAGLTPNASYTSILTPKMPPCFGRVNTHGDGERDGET